MIGHIKIDRKILNWEWYNDYKMVHLFLHLLIKANWVNGTWRGQTIKRGQYITSVAKLSGNTGLSTSQIRTCLTKLQMTGEIAIETASLNTLITICKYDVYQSEKKQDSKQNSKPLDTPIDKQDSKPDSNNIIKQEDKKEFINKPTPDYFNGLPDIKIGSVVQLFKITKYIDVTSEDVKGLWEIFKVQNLTGKKYYEDEDSVYSHFINWSKTQSFTKKGEVKKYGKPLTKQEEEIEEQRKKLKRI